MVTGARVLAAKKSLSAKKPEAKEEMLVATVFPESRTMKRTASRASTKSINAMDLIKAIRMGVPGGTIKSVADKLEIPMNEMYGLLHISPRTAQRMINTPKLDPDLSDRIVQLMKIHDRCLEVFEDREKMIRWLKTPNFALGDQTPLSLLDTTDGIELVCSSLTKIDYGVFA